jgi:hypothetical protein
MAATDLERFVARCLAEPELWTELGPLTDRACFVQRAVDLGTARGLRFTAAELEAALDRSARAWLERWLP